MNFLGFGFGSVFLRSGFGSSDFGSVFLGFGLGFHKIWFRFFNGLDLDLVFLDLVLVFQGLDLDGDSGFWFFSQDLDRLFFVIQISIGDHPWQIISFENTGLSVVIHAGDSDKPLLINYFM